MKLTTTVVHNTLAQAMDAFHQHLEVTAFDAWKHVNVPSLDATVDDSVQQLQSRDACRELAKIVRVGFLYFGVQPAHCHITGDRNDAGASRFYAEMDAVCNRLIKHMHPLARPCAVELHVLREDGGTRSSVMADACAARGKRVGMLTGMLEASERQFGSWPPPAEFVSFMQTVRPYDFAHVLAAACAGEDDSEHLCCAAAPAERLMQLFVRVLVKHSSNLVMLNAGCVLVLGLLSSAHTSARTPATWLWDAAAPLIDVMPKLLVLHDRQNICAGACLSASSASEAACAAESMPATRPICADAGHDALSRDSECCRLRTAGITMHAAVSSVAVFMILMARHGHGARVMEQGVSRLLRAACVYITNSSAEDLAAAEAVTALSRLLYTKSNLYAQRLTAHTDVAHTLPLLFVRLLAPRKFECSLPNHGTVLRCVVNMIKVFGSIVARDPGCVREAMPPASDLVLSGPHASICPVVAPRIVQSCWTPSGHCTAQLLAQHNCEKHVYWKRLVNLAALCSGGSSGVWVHGGSMHTATATATTHCKDPSCTVRRSAAEDEALTLYVVPDAACLACMTRSHFADVDTHGVHGVGLAVCRRALIKYWPALFTATLCTLRGLWYTHLSVVKWTCCVLAAPAGALVAALECSAPFLALSRAASCMYHTDGFAGIELRCPRATAATPHVTVRVHDLDLPTVFTMPMMHSPNARAFCSALVSILAHHEWFPLSMATACHLSRMLALVKSELIPACAASPEDAYALLYACHWMYDMARGSAAGKTSGLTGFLAEFILEIELVAVPMVDVTNRAAFLDAGAAKARRVVACVAAGNTHVCEAEKNRGAGGGGDDKDVE